jgi:hypothetical protein
MDQPHRPELRRLWEVPERDIQGRVRHGETTPDMRICLRCKRIFTDANPHPTHEKT